jgi:hypothetical protein
MPKKGSSSSSTTSSKEEYVPPSGYSITKPYGGFQNFAHSYGLKMYNPDDVDEANRIIDAFKEQDRRDWEEGQAAKRGN